MKEKILELMSSQQQPIRLDQIMVLAARKRYDYAEARQAVLDLIQEGKITFGTNVFLWIQQEEGDYERPDLRYRS